MADKTTTERPINDKLSAEQETPVQSQSPPANPVGLKFSMKMNSMAGSKSKTSSKPPTEPSLNSHPATAKSKPASIVPIKMSLTPKVSGTKRVATDDVVVAKVFSSDDLGDDEEMPPEAKMRMRNLGKDTPTASGPNSFNKGKLGFCNRQKAIEKDLSLIKPH